MIHNNPPESRTLGADIRALRKARGITLTELGETLDRSVGWLSQVERDLSEPSITDLRDIARALDVSVSSLFRSVAPDHEQGLIVRGHARRPIGSRAAGLVEELLSPDLTDDFEMLHSTFEAGSKITEPVTRPTQEVGYIVSGRLDLTIAERSFSLTAGDSFRVRGEPFRWMNPYDEPCVAIWVIAPPIY
ncbi:helix-turn-helix domain-containing protein [Octadecabacter sp. 1_MG-2023]|uniref:helix-turn-helix domain-containing protein n=1 Tax=unclassified Octadecabacter TaxID=196158 RepID=UPI001C09F0F3|nr:helix-turn-helix domain-containing protein [Octadecabacter sp. 1_MG-2023]MBU2992138.1 helix-turn-helix domain-containing protein [Octadecabacter sp. B2R22]MDO6735106.1 helix-turn-helix domain-containing protein [Octadecabacter sp. 1_MG-2023]